MTDLPINVEFAASYLDAIMDDENAEIRRQWQTIRKHLAEGRPETAIDDDRGPDTSVDGTIAASVRIDVVVRDMQTLVERALEKYATANSDRPKDEVLTEFEEMYGTVEKPDVAGMMRLLYDDGMGMAGVSVQDSHATIRSCPIPLAG